MLGCTQRRPLGSIDNKQIDLCSLTNKLFFWGFSQKRKKNTNPISDDETEIVPQKWQQGIIYKIDSLTLRYSL